MQLQVYISSRDYETLAKNKPSEFATVPSFIADIIRKHAEAFGPAPSLAIKA